jgi:eukaryotic-like serine/threonine-protein kinase
MVADLLSTLQAGLSDRYRTERELGRGGMAVVFLAEDLKHHRRVALKVLRPELTQALGGGPERFLREVAIAAQLTHPHILPLLDSGTFDYGNGNTGSYYAMPFVDGESLRDRLTRERQLPLEDALRVTAEIADALSYAHAVGVVHRDIKPENILFEAGHAVVTDFGIARAIEVAGGERLTETGLIVGTPAYMSPEQATGGPVDGRSDLYSLGCVLYEMLVGEPPFTGPTTQAILARKSTDTPPSLRIVRETVPEAVEHTVSKVLARVPADRFATAARFSEALEAGFKERAPSPRARGGRKLWVGALAAGVIVTLVAIALAVRPAAAVPRSVAVLYFDYLSRDTADAYLADGLTEEITSRLGDVGRLQVKSRSAVRRFRGATGSDLAGIGRALGVGYLVEGSVQPVGDRVRASIRLIDARTGFETWGSQYDRAKQDLLLLQEDIARDVAIQIAGRLIPAERSAIAARATGQSGAYDHFLRGNYYLAQRNSRAVARAIEEYETAARLDTEFTGALGRAAYSYAIYAEWGWPFPGMSADTLVSRGIALANRALARDSTVTDAWMARSLLLEQIPGMLTAERDAAQRAAILDPQNAEAWHQYAWTLLLERDETAARAAINRVLAIDPSRAITVFHIAGIDLYDRRYDKALPWMDSSIAVDPTFAFAYAFRSLVRLHLGNVPGALADAQTAMRIGGEDRQYGEAALVAVQVRLGDTVAARASAEHLATAVLQNQRVGIEAGWYTATALVAVGQNDRALDVLERVRPRGRHLWCDVQWVGLDPLRSTPRFRRLMAASDPP